MGARQNPSVYKRLAILLIGYELRALSTEARCGRSLYGVRAICTLCVQLQVQMQTQTQTSDWPFGWMDGWLGTSGFVGSDDGSWMSGP